MRETFAAALTGLGLDLPAEVQDRILAYFELLGVWNERVNLVSRRQDMKTQVVVHLADSLTPLLWPVWPARPRILDIGSGGGLPALPLALARPAWSWTLAEARGRKVVFLEQAKVALGLAQVKVQANFLSPGRNEEGLFYDLVTARAVGNLAHLAALAGPRLKPGGQLLAFKGPQADQELQTHQLDLARWKLGLTRRLDLTLPLAVARRSLLLFTKG